VWPRIAEACADVFAATKRPRGGLVALVLTFLLGLVLASRWGLRGLVPLVVLVGAANLVALDVARARSRVWSAARLPLDEPGQAPPHASPDRLTAPTAWTLGALATAIDAARRGRYGDAHALVPRIDRKLLRTEEARLLEAVRGMVSLGLGDDRRAAELAVSALPTGAEELDRCLGRALVGNAWAYPERLSRIDDAWAAAGVADEGPDALPRLRRLVRIRLAATPVEALPSEEARELGEEARAVGDHELASDLDVRARLPSGYRG
jgi:hypothetical protein